MAPILGDDVASQVILGRNANELGALVVTSIGSGLSAGMSAGACAKTPAPTDVNEDACAIGASRWSRLLVVADAHGGREASEFAIASLLDAFEADPELADPTSGAFQEIVFQAGIAVQRGTSGPDCLHVDSRTTLAFALIIGDVLRWGSFGDSIVIVGSASAAATLNSRRPAYLGYPFSRGEVHALTQCGTRRLHADERVILATDGLVERPTGRDAEISAGFGFESTSSAEEIVRNLLGYALSESVADAVSVAVATPG